MAAVAAAAQLESLALQLSAASGEPFLNTANTLIQQGAQRIQKEAQTRAPIKSGRLRDSIAIRYPRPLTAIIGSQLPYAAYQEFGTGSRGEFGGAVYEIRPKRAGGVLVFKVNGKVVYARKVRHPGIKAQPFIRPAFEAALGTVLVKQLADAGMAAIVKGPLA